MMEKKDICYVVRFKLRVWVYDSRTGKDRAGCGIVDCVFFILIFSAISFFFFERMFLSWK